MIVDYFFTDLRKGVSRSMREQTVPHVRHPSDLRKVGRDNIIMSVELVRDMIRTAIAFVDRPFEDSVAKLALLVEVVVFRGYIFRTD